MSRTLPPAVLAIIERVAMAHGVTASDILGDSQRRKIAHARQEACAAIRNEVSIGGKPPSLPRIGLWIGLNHSTVLYGITDHEIRSGIETPENAAARAWVKKVKARLELRRQQERAARAKERAASLERRLAWSRDVPRVPLATKGRAAA